MTPSTHGFMTLAYNKNSLSGTLSDRKLVGCGKGVGYFRTGRTRSGYTNYFNSRNKISPFLTSAPLRHTTASSKNGTALRPI